MTDLIALAIAFGVCFWMVLVVWGLLAIYRKLAEGTELLRALLRTTDPNHQAEETDRRKSGGAW